MCVVLTQRREPDHRRWLGVARTDHWCGRAGPAVLRWPTGRSSRGGARRDRSGIGARTGALARVDSTSPLFAPQIQWAVLISILLVIAAHLRRERKLSIQAEEIGLMLHLQ